MSESGKTIKINDFETVTSTIDTRLGGIVQSLAERAEGRGYPLPTEKDSLNSVLNDLRANLEATIGFGKEDEFQTQIGQIGEPDDNWTGFGFNLNSLFTQEVVFGEDLIEESINYSEVIAAIRNRGEEFITISSKQVSKYSEEDYKFRYNHHVYGLLTMPWEEVDERSVDKENMQFIKNMKSLRKRLFQDLSESVLTGNNSLLLEFIVGLREYEAGLLGEDLLELLNFSVADIVVLTKKFGKSIQRGRMQKIGDVLIDSFLNHGGLRAGEVHKLDFLDSVIKDNIGYEFEISEKESKISLRMFTELFLDKYDDIVGFLSESSTPLVIDVRQYPLFKMIGVKRFRIALNKEGEIIFDMKFLSEQVYGSNLEKETLKDDKWVSEYGGYALASDNTVRLFASIAMALILDAEKGRDVFKHKSSISIRKLLKGGNHIRTMDRKKHERQSHDRIDSKTAEIFHNPQYVNVVGSKLYIPEEFLPEGMIVDGSSMIESLLARTFIKVMPDKNKRYRVEEYTPEELVLSIIKGM